MDLVNRLCQLKNVPNPTPTYEEKGSGFFECTLSLFGIRTTSTARGKQAAKNDAARKLMQMIGDPELYQSSEPAAEVPGENMEPKECTLDHNDGTLSSDEWDTLQTQNVLAAYLSTREGIAIKERPTKADLDQLIADSHLCFKREGEPRSKTLDRMIKHNQVGLGTNPPATAETYNLMKTILKELEIDFDIRQLETIGPGEQTTCIKLRHMPVICGMGQSSSVNQALYKAAAEVVGTVVNLYM